MDTIFNESVSDLSQSKRESLELILGRPLDANQRVFIQVFDPSAAPDETRRRAALASLERTFAKTDEYARRHGITSEDADAAVEEAMNHVRRRPA